MATYPNLIKEICRTEKTINNVSLTISVLIKWAQCGLTTKTYSDLNSEIGKPKNFRPGVVLGYVHSVLKRLRVLTGEADIPELSVLVKKTAKGLPSYGFAAVYPDFNSYPLSSRREIVNSLCAKAISYPNWDTVLQALCLKPSVIDSEKDEAAIRSGKYHGSGEGPEHKALKEFICAHPESVGARNVTLKETERILLSGDRLDVYFVQEDGTQIAVEVKSIVSPDDDILRGLYQCVKYKAILDAENKAHARFGKVRCLLVIEGKLSESNRQVKNLLGVNVIESFEKK